MGVDKLKNVRTQRYSYRVLLFCVWRLISAYTLCIPRAQADTDCVLAFLRRWFQPCFGQEICNPVFRPYRPRVAVLRAGSGRSRSPPERPRVGPHRAAFARTGTGNGAGIFFLCLSPQARG